MAVLKFRRCVSPGCGWVYVAILGQYLVPWLPNSVCCNKRDREQLVISKISGYLLPYAGFPPGNGIQAGDPIRDMTDTLRHESYFEVTYVRRNRKCLEKCGRTRGGGIRWG